MNMKYDEIPTLELDQEFYTEVPTGAAARSELTELLDRAARLCDAPMAALMTLDRERAWFIESTGLSQRVISSRGSFCAHVVTREALLRVEDARADARFRDHELVAGHVGVVGYLGLPFHGITRQITGAICVMTSTPRAWSDRDVQVLEMLRHSAELLLEQRQLNGALARVQEDFLGMLTEQREVVAGLSHDMLNLAACIFSNGEWLREEVQDPSLLGAVDDILDAIERMSGKISALTTIEERALGNAPTEPEDTLARRSPRREVTPSYATSALIK